MNTKLNLSGVVAALVLSCAIQPSLAEGTQGQQAVEDLEKATKDSSKGSTAKAAKELEEAKQHLIKENKAHPYAEPMKQISGDAPKAEADRKAFRELEKAEADAKKKVAGDAADEAKKALSDVQEKEKAH